MGDHDIDQGWEPDAAQPDDAIITGTPDPDYATDESLYIQADPKKKKRSAPPAPRRRGTRWPLLFAGGCLGLCALCCVVPFCLFAATAGGVATIASNSAVTSSTTETLAVDPDAPVHLTVNNPVGAVNITRGLSDEVVITYTRRAYGWNNSRAENQLDHIEVAVDQPETNTIQVAADSSRDGDTLWSRASNVELSIRVPPNVRLTINSSVGAINIKGVHAEALDLTTSVGGIVFEGTLSDDPAATFRADTTTGGSVFRLPADVYVAIDAETSVGGVDIDSGFDRIAITEEQRNVTEERWRGSLGSGDADPPMLTLRSSTGGIVVEVQ